MFEVDEFVRRCRSAAAGSMPVDDLRELVGAAVADPTAVAHVLGTKVDAGMGLLHVGDDLVIQRAVFPRGYSTGLHEHRLWTISGTYAGCERHELYRVAGDRLQAIGVERSGPGEVQVLAPDVAHDVRAEGDEHLGVLHVYVGNLFATGAGEWDSPEAARRAFTDAWLERLLADLRAAELLVEPPG
jgi:predicted metal-dependent enzyme (double-stranded beta helix superfamily)